MAEVRFDQFTFTQGELDPRIQSRVDWESYYKGAQQIRNAQVLPQGGVQRRWGSVYVDTCSVGNATEPTQFEMTVLLYDDGATYLIIWEPESYKIYLENTLVYSASTTLNNPDYKAEDIANLRFSQVEDRLIITNLNFKPAQLVRSANSPNAITAIDTTNNYITLTSALTNGAIYPVQFTTGGSLPTTSPQIYTGRNYFIRMFSTTNARIYSTPADAAANTNFYTISALGASSNVIVYNTWTLSYITFINTPAYDFSSGYSAITFTPSATSGNSVTITLSSPLANLTSATFVGGLFTGGGGILRITSVADTSHFTGYTITSFAGTGAIEGTLCFLGEPAWSDVRGWPKYSTFFQNRLVFGGSYSLPNGVWLSVVNSAFNFDDSEALDDNAIGWYPAGGSINLIVALTSARSLLVHTNNGTFSTPLLNEAPVTPVNFTLTEQNKFSVSPIQPIFLDNQIIFVDSASNVINMIWEITQSAFVTNNISVKSSSIINTPVDTASFYEPKATDGFYGFFVNDDGTLAVYQTLYQENIAAWCLMNTATNIVADQTQGYTTTASNYIHVITGYNRCWFLVQRYVPVSNPGKSIIAIDNVDNTFTATAHGLAIGSATLITFSTAGSLPTTTPQIDNTQYWWARGINANTFAVYTSNADATADDNRVHPTNLGSGSSVISWSPTAKVYIEELSFDVQTDMASSQTLTSASTSVSGLSWLNGLVVNVKGDGYLLQDRTVFNSAITTEYAASSYEVGGNYVSTLKMLPISLPQVYGTLYKPKHVRTLYIRYYQTIGATVQGFGIPIETMQQVTLGTLPEPQNGVYEATPMEGWSSFDPSEEAEITIQQPNPLPMTILGLSYVLEVS